MPSKRLKYFLDNSNVRYQVMNHAIAFSALEISEATHVPQENIAKTIIMKTPDQLFMCIIRSNDEINIDLLKQITHQTDITLATESEFSREFPDCEVGAMPPFGNLYDMHAYVSDALKDKDIYFNAGNHSELIKLSYADYERLTHPKVVHITAP